MSVRLGNTEDLAVIFRTTDKGVRRMRERGILPPALKVGSRVLWDLDELDRWIADQREVLRTESSRD